MPGGLRELEAREPFMSDLSRLLAPGLLLVLVRSPYAGIPAGEIIIGTTCRTNTGYSSYALLYPTAPFL
jgi:hypothetical protein